MCKRKPKFKVVYLLDKKTDSKVLLEYGYKKSNDGLFYKEESFCDDEISYKIMIDPESRVIVGFYTDNKLRKQMSTTQLELYIMDLIESNLTNLTSIVSKW